MITLAVSVLGAVEGLEVAAAGLERFVVPIAIGLLSALFVFQRFGTELVGRAFGPVMLVWFLAIGVLGLVQVLAEPSILTALSPTTRSRSSWIRAGRRSWPSGPSCW